jgi:hypothetical protein
MFFYFLTFLLCLLLIYIFYNKFFKKSEGITSIITPETVEELLEKLKDNKENGYENDFNFASTDDRDKILSKMEFVNYSEINYKEMQNDLSGAYMTFTPYTFEKNGVTCGVIQSKPLDKLFQRIVVPEDMAYIDHPYKDNEHVDNDKIEVYPDDPHIDETDNNMKQILNYKYDSTDTIYTTNPEYVPSSELIDEGTEYNGYTLKYFNKDKIDTVYQENYDICTKGIYDTYGKLDDALSCSIVKCYTNNETTDTIFNDLKNELETHTKNTVKEKHYKIMASTKFGQWLQSLKNSNDKIENAAAVV